MGYSVINRPDVEPKIRFLDTLYSEIFFRFLVADKDKRGIANVTDEGWQTKGKRSQSWLMF